MLVNWPSPKAKSTFSASGQRVVLPLGETERWGVSSLKTPLLRRGSQVLEKDSPR